MLRAQSPIKVHEATKEKVRYAALMAGLKQAELVERAVDEYVERHREDFAQRMEQAQEALLGGKSTTLAYSLGVSETDVQRVGGVAADQLGARRPRRATSNQASSPEGQSARGSHSSASAAARPSRRHIPQALLDETPVGCLSPDRNQTSSPVR
jgi:hypothetical protein